MEMKELWPGGILYAGDPVGADSLALADFAAAVEAERICDLGCGCGVLLLLLGWEKRSASLYGVELRSAAAEQARACVRANGFSNRCEILPGDWRTAVLPGDTMDLVVSNPPYFPAGAGGVPDDPDRAAMRVESSTVGELCAAAARLLRPGGSFCLVHRCIRMPEVFGALRAAGLEPRELRLTAADTHSEPRTFLCRAQKGASPGLTVAPVLYQYGADGRETPEYRKICHWEDKP